MFDAVDLSWDLVFRDSEDITYTWNELDHSLAVWFKESVVDNKLYMRVDSTESENHVEVKTDWQEIGWVDAYNLIRQADRYGIHISLHEFNIRLMEEYLKAVPKLLYELRESYTPGRYDISNLEVEF